ncbi:MAG: hypothetical protein MUE31_11675, partial [Candidatus Nanopelagicales bacterium]|nr:hypothetical protein [Candidatus Nanopelagicales bacterium]
MSRSLATRHELVVAEEFGHQPLQAAGPALQAEDLADLPAPVGRYIQRSGAIGRPRPQNMRVVLEANMYRKPGQAPMRA